MKRWVEQADKAQAIKVTYNSIGSGGGISKVLAGEVDFGATDAPVARETLASSNAAQFPIRFGGIVPVVNIPGITSNQLRLTPQLLGAIYTGRIKNWSDPEIAAANPGKTLPKLDITPLSQGTSGALSGTTHTFAHYLLGTNEDWQKRHGAAITKRWAVGSQVQTIELMVETMKVLSGSIGYVSISGAARDGLTTVMLKNKAGNFVAANAVALNAAVAQVDWAKSPDLVADANDMPGAETWPIVAPTYIVLPKSPKDKARGEATRGFLHFILVNGAAAAEASQSALVPAKLHGTIEKLMAAEAA